jgi:hypothetical protein
LQRVQVSSLLLSHVSAEPTRELAVRRLSRGEISCMLEPLSRVEQVCSQVGLLQVDAEPLDEAIPFHDSAARLPERASLVRTSLHLTSSGEAEGAVLGVRLVHAPSVELDAFRDIRRCTDRAAAFY